MQELPIRRLVIYKHGVGYFERRGAVSGTSLRLSFPRAAMDDVLKSLVALDLGGGQVLGVDFETPEDRAARVARGSIHLSDEHSLLDLLRDLRGRQVRLHLEDADAPVEGLVVGVDLDEQAPLKKPLVSLYLPAKRQVLAAPVRSVERLELLEDRAAEDLSYFLRASQGEEERRAATLRLSEGDHDLLVGYVAPAPAWRVSYRILVEEAAADDQPPPADAAGEGSHAVGRETSVLLQGWGLFDNQLEEDLENVELTLVAGMPVSFRYRLYEPHTPERPLVQDETRTVAAPVEFGALPPPAVPAPAAAPRLKRAYGAHVADEEMASPAPMAFSIDATEATTQAASAGEERGALFQYQVSSPVSVSRGQSAMVPIVSQRSAGRKELLYNGAKLARHPVASIRMRNDTGLTLERGPVTVLEQGDYAGEAVLPFTRPGGELIVPYAVELGITVVEEHSSERQTAGLSVRDQYLLIEEWDVRRRLYRITSTLSAPAEVTIEQPLMPGYELFDTPQPGEQAQGLARWAVTCAAGAETVFTVQQRSKTTRHEHVRGISGPQLRDYLRGRFLDEATFRGLAAVLALYGQIEKAQARLQEIERERQPIYKRQQQTQQSLTPLGREGDEGALRARYVALLGELEDQLSALAAEEQRLRDEIAQLEQRAAQALAALSR
ncbi:MAG: hypothetical protein DIU80_001770 [Chloroflexota bacterium]